MQLLKCKMCGGDIRTAENQTYGTCDSCGSVVTLPQISDERRANLFNRANYFRQTNQFDKAIAAFERILEEDDRDAEAHWGVALSRYGIEYVEDPQSHARLIPDFKDYGVDLARFFVTTVVKPEEDRAYQKFKELHFRRYADIAEAKLRQQVGVIDQQTQTQRMVIESQGLASKRAQEGYTYEQERRFDVAERMAANEAVGQMSNLGIGLGVMAGIGPAVGSLVGNTVQTTLTSENAGDATVLTCTQCNQKLPAQAKFCPHCGQKVPTSAQNTVVCPVCGEHTPGNAFCIFCGAAIKAVCPQCKAELPSEAKFCPECGAPR